MLQAVDDREMERILEASFDGIFVTDGKGVVCIVNRAYERITGIRREDVLGRSMMDLVKEGLYHQSVTMRVLKSHRTETIVQRLRSGKNIVVTGNPVFDNAGEIWRVVTNARDIAEIAAMQHLLAYVVPGGQDSGNAGIIIRSRQMREIDELARRLGPVDSTVLVLGESGTGKEVCAGLVYRHSKRSQEPCLKVSCSAIAETLLESELFGYAPGAFTGASREGKKGFFEKAHSGTLFLDEIGELPLHVQAKLLRVLQERQVTPVGSTTAVPVDVRIICATNRDLAQMVRDGTFRKDLYYRLNVVAITASPLREQRGAISSLTYEFLNRYNMRYGLNHQIDPDVLEIFVNYDWPGNIRELKNTVESLVVTVKGSVILPEDLPAQMRKMPIAPKMAFHTNLQSILDRTEKGFLEVCIRRCRTTRQLARRLGISQSSVVRKLRRHGLTLGQGA